MDITKNKNTITAAILVIIIASICQVFLGRQKPQDTLFQFSTIDGLLAGLYDGELSIKELKKHGDFGHGTYHALDGEMFGLDGKFFKVNYDGSVTKVKDEETTPFANVVFFETDFTFNPRRIVDFDNLQEYISSDLKEPNYFYAIKIHGNFDSIKVRSVPKQDKPYKDLKIVINKQSLFDYKNISGTLVGFHNPSYIKGINVPKFHFHFLSDDQKKGGHLLAFNGMNGGKIEVDQIKNFAIKLPSTNGFARANLRKDRSKELNKVEK